jgi:hypothetical protein
MDEISFDLVFGMDGVPSMDAIQFTDETGTVWTVPLGAGHRFETQFDEFLADGGIVGY